MSVVCLYVRERWVKLNNKSKLTVIWINVIGWVEYRRTNNMLFDLIYVVSTSCQFELRTAFPPGLLFFDEHLHSQHFFRATSASSWRQLSRHQWLVQFPRGWLGWCAMTPLGLQCVDKSNLTIACVALLVRWRSAPAEKFSNQWSQLMAFFLSVEAYSSSQPRTWTYHST